MDKIDDLIAVGFLCYKISDKVTLVRALEQLEKIENVNLDDLIETLCKLIDLSFLGQALDLQEKLLSVSMLLSCVKIE